MGERLTRERNRPLKVYATPDDRERIKRLAESAGLSVSDYLLTLGKNHEPKSRIDAASVRSLIKIAADQGRVGGLLKLYLTGEHPAGGPPDDLEELARKILNQVLETQQDLRAYVLRLSA